MATIHNELRRSGGLLSAIRAILGVTDPDSGVERFGETLTPVLDPWRRPEHAFLRGERLASGVLLSQFDAAGDTAHVALVNPAGSRSLVVVHFVRTAGATADLRVATEAAILAAGFVEAGERNWRDRRGPGPSSAVESTARLFRGSIVGTVGSAITITSTTHQLYDQHFPVILSPGSALNVRSSAIDLDLTVELHWHERIALPGEL